MQSRKKYQNVIFYLIAICTTLFTLTIFIPKTTAQDNVVKAIYFHPNDISPDVGINATLDTNLKQAQSFFADVMDSHGFGRKTFQLDTDSNNRVIVDHVEGNFKDTHYHKDTFLKVLDELTPHYNTSQTIYYIAIDLSIADLIIRLDDRETYACGVASGNWAATAAGGCYDYSVIAHELGHTFGLKHNIHSNGAIDTMVNNPCAAEWLDVNPFLNGGYTDTGATSAFLLPPRPAPTQGDIRFSFQVSDPDGVHQAQLFDRKHDTVIACKGLNGENATFHLDISQLDDDVDSIILAVIDKSGNHIEFNVPVNVSELLNKSVIIRDTNLDAIIRENINIPPTTQLTSQILATLTSLELTDSNRQITDLTGLEQALNLETLRIQNQSSIADFSPISSLTGLSSLEISYSQFTNLSLLSPLTNLSSLTLSGNSIQDISALSGLTNLTSLDLSNNQITNFNSLFSLSELKQLWLTGNTITDKTQLLSLKEQNPDLVLYIDVDESVPNTPPTFLEEAETIRWVIENTPIGTRFGSSISATDTDLDQLTYSISSSVDGGVFNIDSRTGKLITNGILDYNTKNKYTINVSVTDGKGGSASITVTINVAPGDGGTIIPELIPIHVSFSELMIPSRGGVHSLPQWLELYNSSKKDTANLRGWQLAIEARDLNGKHRHGIISLNTLYIPPEETALIVTWQARQKDILIAENQIYSFFTHHFDEFEQNQYRNMLIGLAGFSLKLTNREGLLVDKIGNLDGDPSTEDAPIWETPMNTTKNAPRTSIMRRYAKDTFLPLDGTEKNNWRSSSDFPLAVSTFWGTKNDLGNPGYRGEGTLPVTLSHFKAEKKYNTSIITWTTESEINNAGFNILRSETLEGEYKIVNPTLIQGAGTTSQRNQYTWTDTTLQENKTYCYRIVEVSFEGIQQELATVRMRGLVSSKEKLYTTWGDLKD
ncbi:cadherin domain-containing protein [Candidatus Poribacteria bacterium]|nr:cadherin domain-containing protein [Candidatus Poribacteria bacterium]